MQPSAQKLAGLKSAFDDSLCDLTELPKSEDNSSDLSELTPFEADQTPTINDALASVEQKLTTYADGGAKSHIQTIVRWLRYNHGEVDPQAFDLDDYVKLLNDIQTDIIKTNGQSSSPKYRLDAAKKVLNLCEPLKHLNRSDLQLGSDGFINTNPRSLVSRAEQANGQGIQEMFDLFSPEPSSLTIQYGANLNQAIIRRNNDEGVPQDYPQVVDLVQETAMSRATAELLRSTATELLRSETPLNVLTHTLLSLPVASTDAGPSSPLQSGVEDTSYSRPGPGGRGGAPGPGHDPRSGGGHGR